MTAMNRMNRGHNVGRILAILAVAAANSLADERATARHIVVSIPDHRLILLDGERVIRTFDVAVGKPSTPSPKGDFRVITRVQHPTWFGPKRVVPPGKANPLGTRWMGLSVRGYGIHGTNAPGSIGKSASHGCIRMRNADVEELFELVPVGTQVQLAGEHTDEIQRILAVAD
jgi:lipoprotein-anchoring transpeptidase ErfK/SrfK